MSKEEAPVWGMGAEFAGPGELMAAAEKAHSKGLRNWDVYSPFPIHGMDDAMGFSNSRVSAFSLLGGCTGAITAFILVFYTGGIDYPTIVHGKPFFGFEPTFPVYFELTILFTAFGTVLGMLLFNQLPRWNHPVFDWERFNKVTDDGFFMIIEASDPQFSEADTKKFLEEIGGMNIELIRNET